MRVQDGIDPLKWKFKGDPTYVWTDEGEEVLYVDTYAFGCIHATGADNGVAGPNTRFDDLYNRVGFVKRAVDAAGNRGYSKNVVKNATGALTLADSGVISVVTDDIGTPPTTAVTLTLPTRLELTDGGVGFFNRVLTTPFLTPQGGGITPFIIYGYQTTSGVPLKVQVATVSPSGLDLAQSIFIDGFSGTEIYLYAGEYAELIPGIVYDVANNLYAMTWVAYVHKSGYANVGKYAQNPAGTIAFLQLKADGATKNRDAFPRLWQILNTGFLSSVLVAQGSKTNATYGDGNGTTTFTLPNLGALNGLVDWCLNY